MIWANLQANQTWQAHKTSPRRQQRSDQTARMCSRIRTSAGFFGTKESSLVMPQNFFFNMYHQKLT